MPIYAGVDPKTVQYLAGHENSQVTIDIYAKVKYNTPESLSAVVKNALKAPDDSETAAGKNSDLLVNGEVNPDEPASKTA